MPQYMLALYTEPGNMAGLSPEQMQQSIAKYMDWMKKPFYVSSTRLAGGVGKVLRPAAGKPRVADGPYSETKEILGGLYIIEAANYDEAVARTQDHPHLELGGTIEVRELWSM